MRAKRFIAAVMAICMITGAVSYDVPEFIQSVSAEDVKADCYSFDEKTGVLTIKGQIEYDTFTGFEKADEVTAITAEKGTMLPENSYTLFSMFSNCVSIDLSNADTSNVKVMGCMFYGCGKLETVDVSSFDTSNVTVMGLMFSGCSALKSVDVSNFDTSNVKDMSCMFFGCSSLTALDLSNFDTSKVTEMGGMFTQCSSLTALDLSNFDTGNVTNMEIMFASCSALTELDVSNFNTSNVTNMDRMFSNCLKLSELDLSSFDTGNVTIMDKMFYNCLELSELDLSSFDTSNVTNMEDIFYFCLKLNKLTLGEKFGNITEEHRLDNYLSWVNKDAPQKVVSGDGEYAVIENTGTNVYLRKKFIVTVYGDVNYDGEMNAADLVCMEKYLLGVPDTIIELDVADLDGDGKVNTFDLISLRELYYVSNSWLYSWLY